MENKKIEIEVDDFEHRMQYRVVHVLHLLLAGQHTTEEREGPALF